MRVLDDWFEVEVRKIEFEIVGKDSSVQQFQDGEVVPLHFPTEKRLVPREECSMELGIDD